MPSVTSELSLMRPDGTEFTEAQMAAADPGTFPDFVGMDGRVTLVHGGDRFDVGDTLLYAVTELCGTIVPQLAADGEAVYGAIAHEEELTFTLSGETIEIDGEELLIMKESDILGIIETVKAAKKKAA